MWEYTGFDPVALQLGPLAVRWYGLMYLVGFVGGWWLMRLATATMKETMAQSMNAVGSVWTGTATGLPQA